MDEFNPQTIANLLLISVVLIFAIMGFRSWCKRIDGHVYDPLRDGPVAQDNQPAVTWYGNAEHSFNAGGYLNAMDSLRRPLPAHRNMEGAVQAGYKANSAPENQRLIASMHCAKVHLRRAKQWTRYATSTETEGGHVD